MRINAGNISCFSPYRAAHHWDINQGVTHQMAKKHS